MTAHVVELVLRGRLSPELIDALDGFDVRTDQHGLTRVVGPVEDQARLIGLVDLFDRLRIEVVSMNPVEEHSPPADQDTETAS